MGALHAGHLSLVRKVLYECDVCVTSVFVNPTQFDDPADLAAYPKSLPADLDLLDEAGCHLAFTPSVQEVYPPGMDVPVHDFGRLEHVFEGAIRPGHFRGMGQVVGRLLQIVEPEALCMGQKDYQQYLIVKKLVNEILGLETEVILCPIVREADGLAMSSRNTRLSPAQRRDAVELGRVLFWIKELLGENEGRGLAELKAAAVERLIQVPSIIAVDYVEIADAETLEPVTAFNRQSSIILGAIRMEGVRLIDNVMM